MSKVLIVDDSPTETHIYKTMLEKNNFDVVTASSGEEGVKMSRSEKPDLILMDVVMPGMNGFQATRVISKEEKTAHIPIIIITTKDQETDKVWGLRQGAKGYIVKPVKEKDLLANINQFIK